MQDVAKQKDRAAIRAENEAKIAEMRAEAKRMRARLEEMKKRMDKAQADWEAGLSEFGMDAEQARAQADARGVTAFVNAVHRQYRKENPPKRKAKGKAKKAHKMVRTKI